MAVTRTELFNYHNVFDLDIDNKHYYAYNIPYYNNINTGRSAYPDGDLFYRISHETYVKFINLKKKHATNLQSYIENEIDLKLINNETICGFEYIGDKKDYLGSQSSAVMQAVISKCCKE